jgi:hypothetical protein
VSDQKIALQVVELPVDRLRRLTLIPDLPREDLWVAIAEAVIDINERVAVVQQAGVENRKTIAQLEQYLRTPPGTTPIQGDTP